MRKFGVIFGLIALVIATSLGITFWTAIKDDTVSKMRDEEREASDMDKVKLLIAANKSDDALLIIQNYQKNNSPKWTELAVKAHEKEKNIQELITLFEISPESFRNNEEAALILANIFILNNNQQNYATLRSITKGKELNEVKWLLLDSDYLLLQNRENEAISLLKSRTFEGKDDIPRLIRLAALKANENPKEAWGYLSEAYKKDPKDVDIRSFRARLLENGNKFDQALLEYTAATEIQSQNLYLKDQLAEFHIRRKEYPVALNIWKSNLSNLDVIWVKALFWNKVVQPLNVNWNSLKIPPGTLEPLITYYIQLKPEQYWDSSTFSKMEGASQFLKSEQSTFWLRLLQNLKDQNENEARNLLIYSPFATNSWNSELESALLYTINYRNEGNFLPGIDQKVTIKEMPLESKNLIAELNQLAKNKEVVISKSLHELLKSNEIYTALFLSADWSEAALQFNTLEIIPATYPQWITTGLVQAMAKNRGAQQALEFANKQNAISSTVLQEAIENASPEARSYMAMKAYKDKNWAKARQLTEQLLTEYPDNQQLRENLKKINEQGSL